VSDYQPDGTGNAWPRREQSPAAPVTPEGPLTQSSAPQAWHRAALPDPPAWQQMTAPGQQAWQPAAPSSRSLAAATDSQAWPRGASAGAATAFSEQVLPAPPLLVMPEQRAAPSVDQTAAPSVDQTAAPSGGQTAAPSVERTAVVAEEEEDGSHEARTGPSPWMRRLHVGGHVIKRSVLAGIRLPSPEAGLVLGRDRHDAAVSMRLFAPEPVRVALVGGVWAAQLLVFRAFALGARVAVVTADPAAWAGFGERATGQYDRLALVSDDRVLPEAGSPHRPVLSVYDLGEGRPTTMPSLGPWRSQLTILRRLDRSAAPTLQDAQFTLLQRLGDEEATLATSALRLRRHTGQFLQFMADDMVALVADGADRYFSVDPTPLERQQVGDPRR
jgi:ESX secretion system protein EccE